jgi:methyl-accepting chemotaxis protein
MGSFKRNIGIKLMGGLRSVDNTVLVSKKLDEKLKELSSIN